MSNQTIRRIPLCEKDKIVSFLNENWGSKHPLVNNDTLFNYYYTDGEYTNFYCCEDDGETASICGYIKSSQKQNSDIWISIWCAKKGKNGLGLALMGKMKELTGASVISCNNIRKNTMAFYTFLGYYPDKLNHYYRLRDLKEYSIPVIKNKDIPQCNTAQSALKEFISIQQVKDNFDNFISKPVKDYWYIEKRYFNYPHYKYNVYGVYKDEKCVALVVFRVNTNIEGSVLRLVDYIGKSEDFALLCGHIDPLLEKYNCQYCDMYSFGVLGESAGFKKRDEADENIIPNYLNPLLQENIDYYFFTSDTKDFLMFKADGDQDRMNIK